MGLSPPLLLLSSAPTLTAQATSASPCRPRATPRSLVTEKEMLPPSKISCDSIQHCGPCTMHLHCGYMNKEKKCVEGGAAGPFNTSLTPAAGDWDYAYCSQDPCSVYQSCSACSADPMCGWCSSTNTCVEGSASGPWLNKCNKASFSFDSCAMSVEAPTVKVAAQGMQANVQEGAMLLSNE